MRWKRVGAKRDWRAVLRDSRETFLFLSLSKFSTMSSRRSEGERGREEDKALTYEEEPVGEAVGVLG